MRLGRFSHITSIGLIGALSAASFLGERHARAVTLEKPHYLRVDPGDTLSEALVKTFPGHSWRLWGKDGAIAKIAALNPQIRDINQITPKMRIDIGKYAVDDADLPTPIAEVPVPMRTEEIKREPASQENETPPVSDETARYGTLRVAPELSYSLIHSVDKTTGGAADYVSGLNVGARFAWGQVWSSRFQTSLNFGVRNESYVAPAGFTLDNHSRTLSDIGVGAQWAAFEHLPRLTLDGRFEARQELFIRATSTTATSIDSVTVPQLIAGVRYRLFEMDPFEFSLHVHELFLLPATSPDYSVRFGTGTALGAALSEKISENVSLSGDFWYFTQSQSSSIATLDRKDVGMTFGVIYRLSSHSEPASRKGDAIP